MPLPGDSHLAQVGTGTTTPLPTQLVSSKEYPVGMLASQDGFILDGKTRFVSQTPTISTSLYATTDALGGLLTFAAVLPDADIGGQVVGLTVIEKATGTPVQPLLDLVLYDRSVTATADNAVWAPSDADLGVALGFISVSAGHWIASTLNAVACVRNIGLPVKANASGNLYGQMIIRSASTMGGTTDLTVVLAVKAD